MCPTQEILNGWMDGRKGGRERGSFLQPRNTLPALDKLAQGKAG